MAQAVIPIIGLAVSVASTAAATGMQVAAQQQAAEFQAQQQRNNALIAGWQRADAMQRGASEAARIEQTGRRYAAAGLARLGASGVSTTEGSPANLLAQSGVNAAADALRARANAARAAWGLGERRRDLLAQAGMTEQAGLLGSIGAGISGFGGALSQGLGGYARISRAYGL